MKPEELNTLVAVEVMLWHEYDYYWWTPDGKWAGHTTYDNGRDEWWNPAGDWGCVGEILKRLINHPPGYSFGYWETPIFSSMLMGPVAVFRRSVHPPYSLKEVDEDGITFIGQGRTGPEAIARAALAAVRGERRTG